MARTTRVPDQVLLADLRRVVEETGDQRRSTYVRRGRYDAGLFWRRFGVFEQACRAAGLPVVEAARRDLTREPDSLATALEDAKQMRTQARRRTQPRRCLRCEKAFPSTGPGNRLCRGCRHTIIHEGLAGGLAC